jgi:glycosyltransferase involved in cell wall biosynthesis
MPARIKAGLPKEKHAPVILVPNALFPKQINYLPFNKIIPNSLVYAGTLGPENGPGLAIAALPPIIKKIPNIHLHIYGGGNDLIKKLQQLIKKLNLNEKVTLHGFMANQIKLSNEIKHYAVGLAPYKSIPGSPRWWADATKIRLYLAAGLPVITTQVPPLGKEVQKRGAGLVTKDKPEDMAKAILSLFRNKKEYLKFRKNAIEMAKNNTWKNTYSNAINRMGLEHK